MFEELDDLKAHLDTLRPIDTDKMMAVQEKLRIDWTYNTNAIEGNTLTLQETAFFLREGLTSKGKPLSEFLEAKNHVEAISFLEEVVKESRPLTERLIKDFHAIVMQDSKYVWIGPTDNRIKKRIEPGNYKYDNNHVVKLDGTIHFYTDHLQVPGEMENLIKWYEENKEKVHPVELAAGLHHKFVAIHPFTDGNGRVARLVMNLVLMQAGYLPAIIKNEDRMEYYSALDAADNGDYAPFIQIVEREAYRTMKMVVDVIEGREAFGKEDLKKMVKGLGEKVTKLDKDIGDISKEVDEETRLMNVKKIVEFFVALVNDITSGITSQEFHFSIVPNVTVSSSTEIAYGMQLKLQKMRKYIPTALYSVYVVPKTVDCRIYSTIEIYSIDGKEEKKGNIQSIKTIELYNFCGDLDKKILEEFFVDSFKVFMKSVEEEIEKRRRIIAENASE